MAALNFRNQSSKVLWDVFDVFKENALGIRFNQKHKYSGTLVEISSHSLKERSWEIEWQQDPNGRTVPLPLGVEAIFGTSSLKDSYQVLKSCCEEPVIKQVYQQVMKTNGRVNVITIRGEVFEDFHVGCFLINKVGTHLFLSLKETRPYGSQDRFTINRVYEDISSQVEQEYQEREARLATEIRPSSSDSQIVLSKKNKKKAEIRYSQDPYIEKEKRLRKVGQWRAAREAALVTGVVATAVAFFVFPPAAIATTALTAGVYKGCNGRKRHHQNCANRLD